MQTRASAGSSDREIGEVVRGVAALNQMDESEAGGPHRSMRQLEEFGTVGFAKLAGVEREEAAVIFKDVTGHRLIDPADEGELVRDRDGDACCGLHPH